MDIEALRRRGVVPPRPLDPTGRNGPTPGQARGRRWRRTGPNGYVPAEVDPAPLEQRIVEAAFGLPDDAAVTGWAALAWQRARWFGGRAGDGRTPLPVPVALGPARRGARPRPDVELTQDWLFSDDVELIDGLLITLPLRSVTFEARRAPHLALAVRAIDMAANNDLIDLEALGVYADRLTGRPGVRQLKEAIGLAEENAWSPQETSMRLTWHRLTGRRPAPNRPVFDLRGNHLFTPDLLDEELGVVGEYNGVVHLADRQQRTDLNRDALLRDLRIEPVTMMSLDNRDIADFRARLEAAYRRVRDPPDPFREWTTEKPGWWCDTSTVAARRALDADQRAMWLRRNIG